MHRKFVLSLLTACTLFFQGLAYGGSYTPKVVTNSDNCSAYLPIHLWGEPIEWRGGCKNGLADGKISIRLRKGRPQFQASMVQGYIEGPIFIRESGWLYKCDFRRSLPNGICEESIGSHTHTFTHFSMGEELEGTGYRSDFIEHELEKKSGEFYQGKLHGFGTWEWSPKYLTEVPGVTEEALNGFRPAIKGNKFYATGIWAGGKLRLQCESKADCARLQQAESNSSNRAANRDAEALRTTDPCSSVYPGKTGTLQGSSSLSIDVQYVVKYVNKDRGTATIEATSTGQLNMNRGEMKELSCKDF